MKSCLAWFLACVVLLMANRTGAGGVVKCDGEDAHEWENGALIVADVVDVGRQRLTRIPLATLKPKMTLAGSFDCAHQSRIECFYSLMGVSSVIEADPVVGSTVAVFLHRYDKRRWLISGNMLTFMPNGQGFCEVDGLDSPKVQQIAEAIGKARKIAAAKQSKHAAERPAAPTDAMGIERGRRRNENRSVIRAQVISAPAQSADVPGRYRLRPLGTVAGRLDPALHAELHVNVSAEFTRNAQLDPPAMSTTVLAVIVATDEKYKLAEDQTSFMPSGAPIVAVDKAMDDELIEGILGALRRVNSTNLPRRADNVESKLPVDDPPNGE